MNSVAIPMPYLNEDGFIDDVKSMGSMILSAMSIVLVFNKMKRFFVLSKKQKYLNRMIYCKSRKKRIHKFKRNSSKYRSLGAI